MKRRSVRVGCIGAAVATAASIAVAGARADGLPVLGIDVGPEGVATPTGPARYVTLPAGRATLVARVERAGGRVLASRLVHGSFTIPAVAYDGTSGGLSADGSTLVLIQPRRAFPRARTTLAILDTRGLRLRSTTTLPGDFSFDAVSPRGAFLYLIQYVNPRDPTRYLVRAYDLRIGHLLAAPVVDPRSPGEKMRGSPLTRATSADGRWAYTLYDGAGGTPFVHALDTSTHTARCVDLDGLSASGLPRPGLRLDPAGRSLTVLAGGRQLRIVDTQTYRVSEPRPARRGMSSQWTRAVVAAVGVALLAGAVLFRRQRRRLAPAQ